MLITVDSWQAYLLFALMAVVPFILYLTWLRRRAQRRKKNDRLLDTVYDKQERRRRGE